MDTRTRGCVRLSGTGGGVSFTSRGSEGAADSLDAAAGCSRRPAGSPSLITKALRGHSSHPLPSPAALALAAGRCWPGQDFPLPSFGKLAQLPVTWGGGRERGRPGQGTRVFRTATLPVSFPGEWPWPQRLSSKSQGRSSGGLGVVPRSFELPAPGFQQASCPRPSLQIPDACGLQGGSA